MKSEAGSRLMADLGADEALLPALAQRTALLQPGDPVDVADLANADPFGAEAFAMLARRFGLEAQPEGGWRQRKAPRWLPNWITTADEGTYLELFEQAFGHRMEPAFWRWKYRDGCLARRPVGRLLWGDAAPHALSGRGGVHGPDR
jgi:hypothetical protein